MAERIFFGRLLHAQARGHSDRDLGSGATLDADRWSQRRNQSHWEGQARLRDSIRHAPLLLDQAPGIRKNQEQTACWYLSWSLLLDWRWLGEAWAWIQLRRLGARSGRGTLHRSRKGVGG